MVCPGHGEGDGRGGEEGVPHHRRRHTRAQRKQRALHEAGTGVRHTRRARPRVARVGGAAAGHVHVRRGAGLRDDCDILLCPNLDQGTVINEDVKSNLVNQIKKEPRY